MKSGQSPTLPTRTRSQAEGPAPTHHSVLDQPLQSQRRSRERRELPRPLREGDRDGNKRCLRERISGRRWTSSAGGAGQHWTSSAGGAGPAVRAALPGPGLLCNRVSVGAFDAFVMISVVFFSILPLAPVPFHSCCSLLYGS